MLSADVPHVLARALPIVCSGVAQPTHSPARRVARRVATCGGSSRIAARIVAGRARRLTDDVAVRAPLAIAVVQPLHEPGNLAGNARQHADAVERAGARVVVFPELSLTGYDLDADAVRLDDDALAPLVRACTATGSIALAGAPVADDADGGVSIATLRVDADGVRVAYRKTYLGTAERVRFRPGPGPLTTQIGGWRTGLGICKDTGVPEHVRQ